MELTYLIKALWRRKWIIIISVLLALIVAYLLTKNTKRLFQSTAQFSTGYTLSDEMKIQDENFNGPQIDLKFNNVVENMTSAKVENLVSYQLMLHDLQDEHPFTRLTEKDKASDKYKQVDVQKAITILKAKLEAMQPLDPTSPDEKAILNYIDLYNYDVDGVGGQLTVTRNQRTDYVNIVSLTPNPYQSAFMANTLLTEFKRFYGYTKRERSDVSVGSLDSLIRQKKEVLDRKVGDKNAFMAANGLVDGASDGTSQVGQLSQYESQLIQERADNQNASYRVSQLDALVNQAKSKGANSVNVSGQLKANDRSEYTRLRKQYNDLNSDYILKGSKDPETKKRLDDLQKQMSKLDLSDDPTQTSDGAAAMDQLIQKQIDAQATLRASNEKIASLQAKIAQLKGGLTGIASKLASIQQFDKDIELARTEYNAANEKLNLAKNISENGNGNFKQTLVAQPAQTPEPSKKFLIIGMAGAASLALSCLVILLIEFFDNSIRSQSNFQRMVDLPVVGLVNWVKLNTGNILQRVTDENEKRSNTFRELLRKLRYEVEHSGKKVFLFTSTMPQQGKTSIIQALAYSLSLGKKRVLIIDTNFCNNDLTKAIHATPSLEKFSLNGKPFALSDLQNFVTPTSVAGVDIIGCEGGDYTPNEILPKNHLLNYISNLKELYDVILLEGAPLNGYTDTKELLQYADTMIAIFSVETVLSSADRESIQFLKENKDKFLGVVLNKIPEENLVM